MSFAISVQQYYSTSCNDPHVLYCHVAAVYVENKQFQYLMCLYYLCVCLSLSLSLSKYANIYWPFIAY
jgi:hypothetical protein